LTFGDSDFNFDDWDREARVDGWICRNDQDCNWIDDHLGCDDRGFSSSGLNGNWPAIFRQDAKGQCACESGYVFDSDEAECKSSLIDGAIKLGLYVIIAIVKHYRWVMLLHRCCLLHLQNDELITSFR